MIMNIYMYIVYVLYMYNNKHILIYNLHHWIVLRNNLFNKTIDFKMIKMKDKVNIRRLGHHQLRFTGVE